jgi:hypothetical protein
LGLFTIFRCQYFNNVKRHYYLSLCSFSVRNCTREGQIKCADAIQCILETRVCDGYSSCLDGSDEGDHCLGNTYALLKVYLIFYLVNDMKSDCKTFILRRQWYMEFLLYGWTYIFYFTSPMIYKVSYIYIIIYIYGWTYTTYCKSLTVRNLYWWHKLFVCLFVCLCSEKRVLTIPKISTKGTIIFTSPYLT